jgi:hypothetical protein
MADDKFTLDIDVNAKDANKKLKDTQKQAQETSETIVKTNKLNIDASGAKKSLQDVSSQIDDLSKKLEEVKENTGNLFDLSKLVVGVQVVKGLFGAFQQGISFVSNTAHQVTRLSNSANSLRISSNQLKGWEDGFKAMGMSAQEADGALKSLSSVLIGQVLNPSIQTASAFAMMGINLRNSNGELKNSSQLMFELADKYKKLPLIKAQALGQLVGQSPELVTQLRNTKTVAEVQKLTGRENVQQSQIDTAKELVQKEAELNVGIDSLKRDAMEPMAKALNNLLDPITKLADEFSMFASHPLDNTIKSIGGGIDSFKTTGIGAWLKDTFANPNSSLNNSSKKVLDFLGGVGSNDKAKQEAALNSLKTESNFGKNTVSATSNARGMLQWMPKTWQSLMGNKQMTPQTEAEAFSKMYDQFSNFAKKNGIAATSQQYEVYHHLGAAGYAKAVNMMKAAGHEISYGDYYRSTGNAALMRQNSDSNKLIPYASSSVPMSTHSSNVQNNINNSRSASVNSSTHIGTMHVTANNPEQFAKQIKHNTQYLDRTANMTGQLS